MRLRAELVQARRSDVATSAARRETAVCSNVLASEVAHVEATLLVERARGGRLQRDGEMLQAGMGRKAVKTLI